MERRQSDDLFVGDEVKLIKQGIVLGKVLVMINLLLPTKPHAVHCNTTGPTVKLIKRTILAQLQSIVSI